MSGYQSTRPQGRGRGESSLPFNSRGRGSGRGEGSAPGSARGPPGPAPNRGDTHHSRPFQGRQLGDRPGGRHGPVRGRGGGMRNEVTLFSHGPGDTAEPNSSIKTLEDEIATSIKLSRTQSSFLTAKLPLRPGYGTQGKEILLWTNHFELVSSGNQVLHRYSVEILPDHSGRRPMGKKARRLVELLLEDHLSQYAGRIATDFRSNLISSTELDRAEDSYNIVYRLEGEDDAPANARHYRIRLLRTGSLTVSELLDDLTSTNAMGLFGSREGIIQALNIVVGHHPKAASHIASIGANRHYGLTAAASDRMTLGAGLAAIRGFLISVRAATGRLLLNIQVKNGAFYEDGPLERLMAAYSNSNGHNLVKLAHFLKKLSINVTHIVRTNKAGRQIPRIKVITGVAMKNDGAALPHPPVVREFGAGPKNVEFWLEGSGGTSSSTAVGHGSSKKNKNKAPKAGPVPPPNGRYISVYNFFSSEHNIVIKNPSLPVLNVGTRENPSYLPAQVCLVRPGQASNMPLSSSQTQQMIRFAVRKPAQNAQSIVTSGAQILGIDSSTLDPFNVDIRPRLITVPGRVLASPSIKYGAHRSIPTRSGSWDMGKTQFTTKATLKSWTYLWISSPSIVNPWAHEEELQSCVSVITAKLRELGINCNECTRGLRVDITPDTVESAIDGALHRFTTSPNRRPPMLVLVIIPSADSAIYNRVKYVCDVKEGLINVCVTASKFANANDRYLTNVALKFNLKLGGINQNLEPSQLGIISESKTMIVGMDVTHPSPGSSSTAPSVVGIVASIDRWLGQWPAELAIQTARKETISELKVLMQSRLALWKRHNGTYPENILIYRDGVSEGQYKLVLEEELPEIRSACMSLYSASLAQQGIPRISIIVVGKRHHTRFYPTKTEEADNSSNPQNGTVVDRGVTEAHNWDFFMQAHKAIQGTARPAHYYIIFDEIFQRLKVPQGVLKNMSDIVEDLTHNLCYLFGRATSAVSICPPAYYADLVCERARCYLSWLYDPSTASSSGSMDGGGQARREADSSMVKIHERVRDTMFYI